MCRLYLILHWIFGLPHVSDVPHYRIITLVCIFLVALSCCPLKKRKSFHPFSLIFFLTLTTIQLWHVPTLGEGAYAIMIIIIKTILMCLVFATQLLIMA